jgi:hypothetical protein
MLTVGLDRFKKVGRIVAALTAAGPSATAASGPVAFQVLESRASQFLCVSTP